MVLLGWWMGKVMGKGVELPRPEGAVSFQPVGGQRQGVRFQPADLVTAMTASAEQTLAFQDTHVLGDRRQAHSERLGQARACCFDRRRRIGVVAGRPQLGGPSRRTTTLPLRWS